VPGEVGGVDPAPECGRERRESAAVPLHPVQRDEGRGGGIAELVHM
jgi:hypothetical protein